MNLKKITTPTEAMKYSADMAFRVPVYLSHSNQLNDVQTDLLNRLIRKLEYALLFPRTVPNSELYPEKTLSSVRRLILSSYGMIAVDLKQVHATYTQMNTGDTPPSPAWQGAPYSQIEPAMAFLRGLPLLLIQEQEIEQAGIWNSNRESIYIIRWDSTRPMEEFFGSLEWREMFQNWSSHVRNGYNQQTEPDFQFKRHSHF